MAKSKYIVMHNYGACEGWRIVGEPKDNMLDAVMEREADVQNGGGETMICEVIDVLDAYRRADYERDKRT